MELRKQAKKWAEALNQRNKMLRSQKTEETGIISRPSITSSTWMVDLDWERVQTPTTASWGGYDHIQRPLEVQKVANTSYRGVSIVSKENYYP
ncbi:hypothetical protein O181_072634 [Austropuccinia psidii MF-1]|uniref:Uncharacterized protein n=1 Tax=Austropuccinia psidii MF-1 TaxID=1389203 RepID=A0A9Q3F555_9BASI|nr:hypothetical protein [Austropuccinia psidii MF-1]